MTVPQEIAGINEPRASAGDAERDPRPSAVNFVTTEHFALQSARAATIAESTGRATTFLTSASGGLIALGLVATATGVGTAFYAFGLVLLPTLATAPSSSLVVALAAMTVLMRFQVRAYRQAATGRLLADLDSGDAQ